ncbi:MAG: hypothetical protein L0Y57_01925 [Beijerinckiaceae bacterium]|nr:hypothetical protein [Beijerinckiaceae bacterium]
MDGNRLELLGALAEAAGERAAKSKTWPDNPRTLAGRLRRAATFLRKVGIEIGFEREGRARTRTIRITTGSLFSEPEKGGALSSAPSASSADQPKPILVNDLASQGVRTVESPAFLVPSASSAYRPRYRPR